MSSLREIRDHIGSVRSTLKITSAMKLVSSSKLRKAQKAVETLLPYQREISSILSELTPCTEGPEIELDASPREVPSKRAVVVIAGNSSMCGAFNANVVKRALDVVRDAPGADVFALGRKASEGLRHAGVTLKGDRSVLISRPSYDDIAAFAASLADAYDGVTLVYNHFVSTSRQEVVSDELPGQAGLPVPAAAKASCEDEYIVEPGVDEVVRELYPKSVSLKLFASVLDSAAAEHAARMIAMQTATDNAEQILSDLTLEYNKGRQQKITAEILDLLGGAQ